MNYADRSRFESIAAEELQDFIDRGAINPIVYTICPCTTGNVGSVAEAEQGQARNRNDARYQGYAETRYPNFWYSYSYYDNEGGANAEFRYLKIY